MSDRVVWGGSLYGNLANDDGGGREVEVVREVPTLICPFPDCGWSASGQSKQGLTDAFRLHLQAAHAPGGGGSAPAPGRELSPEFRRRRLLR